MKLELHFVHRFEWAKVVEASRVVSPETVVVFFLTVLKRLPLVPGSAFDVEVGFALASESSLEFAAILPVLRGVGASFVEVSVDVTVSTSSFRSVVWVSTGMVGMWTVAPRAYLVVPKSFCLGRLDRFEVLFHDGSYVSGHLLRAHSKEWVVKDHQTC